MSSSSQSLNFSGTGELVALFSHQSRLNQDAFSEREQPVDVLRGNESIFRDADPANVAKSLPEGNRDHLLTEARSELMKQEHKVKSHNNCIVELQQQAYAQRLDLENAHHGYVETRREQVRLQEELVMKGKSTSRNSNTKYSWIGINEESSRTTSWRILCTEVERKSWNNTETHFTSCKNCKKRWIIWMILENVKKWSRIIVDHVHTFPLNLQGFQVHALC